VDNKTIDNPENNWQHWVTMTKTNKTQ